MEDNSLSSFSNVVPADNILLMHQRDVSIPEQNIISGTELEKGNVTTTEGENNNDILPKDILTIIRNKLDFNDDLFNFGGVSHDWRESFKEFLAQFMECPAPLIFQISRQDNEHAHFLSLLEGKSYILNLPKPSFNMPCHHTLQYVGFSSGFMIMVKYITNKFFLLNPFMRTSKMQIPEVVSPPKIRLSTWDHAILTFAVGSQDEFIIVAISMPQHRLFAYQSRNGAWMCYDKNEHLSHNVVDVVVLHRAIYVINASGHIGVMSLNTPRVNFIQLRDKPMMSSCRLKLVVSEGQLLVVQLKLSNKVNFVIYRIDFTMMGWVKLETLGNRSLFVSKDTKCYALSDPGKWGYEANHIYYIDGTSVCKVYGMDGEPIYHILADGRVVNNIDDGGVVNNNIINGGDILQVLWRRVRPGFADWCFRNIREEVDYSLED